jgi:putative isomerase
VRLLVIFDWDNLFATYMTSLDPSSKEIAYSNLIQTVRSATAAGFVPNYSAGGRKSQDRTEPPIGAKVLLEVYRKYGDAWLVELLFDDLLDWNEWFVASRMLGPGGLVSLGSDTIDGYADWSAGQMQGARYESGLDNSPMFDGDFFEPNASSIGSRLVGQMTLYDVGMESMFVQEAEALAALAPIAGKAQAVADKLAARAASHRQKMAEQLWDPEGQIFTDRWWNGTFYRRITPTSFYSMLATAATDEQARAMVTKWLLSPEHFCIAPNGDFAGNHDDCYWGLPSIQRADAAFPPLGYWRGYVWGPMAQLV